MSDIAQAWIDALVRRGVTLKTRGAGRLEMVPGRAYGEMSDDELLTLRHHRAEIVAIIEAQGGTVRGVVASATTETPARAPEPPLEFCAYCRKTLVACAELRATRLDVWRDLHYDHPDEVQRRNEAATAEMFESLRRYGPARY